MEEKPLHVRVAEALGCRLAWHGFGGESIMGDWACVCASGEHGEEAVPSYVLRYDLEWSAAGPLIEEYGISLHFHTSTAAPWEAGLFIDGGYDGDYLSPSANAPQPLIAVCNLILGLGKIGMLEQLRATAEAR